MDETGDGAAEIERKPSIFSRMALRLRGYFFTGILVTAPISITLYVAWAFIKFVDLRMEPLMPAAWRYQSWDFPGMGLVAAVVSLTLIGWAMAGVLGRLWLSFSGRIISRMPVLSGIYSTLRQLFETVFANKSQAFREVVLIEYPRRGLWTIAFLTGDASKRVADNIESENIVNVFVPTTPNPTSGFLLFLPETDVKRLDISVEEGLKLVISTGIVAPSDKKQGPDLAKRKKKSA